MPKWTEKEMAVLREGIASGMSYTQIGKKLHITRSAVSGAVFRLKHGKQKQPKKLCEVSWDRRTFETWEERKRRLARERANVRA